MIAFIAVIPSVDRSFFSFLLSTFHSIHTRSTLQTFKFDCDTPASHSASKRSNTRNMSKADECRDQEPLMGLYLEENSSNLAEPPNLVLRKWNNLSIKTKFAIHCSIFFFYFIFGAFIIRVQKCPGKEPRCPQSSKY